MTLDSCAASCFGFLFLGVKDGSDCLCGNDFDPLNAMASEAECNVPCGGDGDQICGAVDFLSAYVMK